MAEENVNVTELGSVEIADEVIKTIAGLAASEVKGIYGLRGGFIEGIRQATTGRRDFTKGVEVKRETEGNAILLDVFVIIEFDVKVSDVAHTVQAAVKSKVESITGQTVKAVNVHVADIRLREEQMAVPRSGTSA